MTYAITRFVGGWDFMSNFYKCPVLYQGIEFPTAEHAYQAAKNPDTMAEFPMELTPGQAKRLGQLVDLRPGWDEGVKLEVMEEILRAKFQVPKLRARLIDTGGRMLVEGNNHGDDYWGMVIKGGRYMGENHLGKLLMKLREEYQLDNQPRDS
jgi:ribA/ribD-fused uncharacterized protein